MIDWKDRETRQSFYQSPLWRTLREVKLSNDPLCEECKRNGILTPATEVHHIKDIMEDPDRRLDITNTESLCKNCHSKETMQRLQKVYMGGKSFEIVNRKWNINIKEKK